MNADLILGGLLFALVASYLLQKKMAVLLVWFIIIKTILVVGFRLSYVAASIGAIVGLYVIMAVTAKTYENFENEESPSPHVDIGTTILHAYRNLTPEQIGGMRRDTRELLELQKELMGSLAEMKPAIEQGAELLKTFSAFFGDQGSS